MDADTIASSAGSRRLEARRRRLLQDPEERLKKIRNLQYGTDPPEVSSKFAEDVKNVEDHVECSSRICKEGESLLQEEKEKPLPKCLGTEEETDNSHQELQTSTQQQGTRTPQQQPTTSSLDFSTFLPSLLLGQYLLNDGQKLQGISSYKTLFMCFVALLFRMLLELDWITTFTGQSMVVTFFAVYVPWLYFFDIQTVNLQSAAVVVLLVLRILQDFACYLFTFVIAHGFICLLSGQDEPGTPENVVH